MGTGKTYITTKKDTNARTKRTRKDKDKIRNKGERVIDPKNKNTNANTLRDIMSCGKWSTCTNIAHVHYIPYPHVVQLAHGDMNSYNRKPEREKKT